MASLSSLSPKLINCAQSERIHGGSKSIRRSIINMGSISISPSAVPLRSISNRLFRRGSAPKRFSRVVPKSMFEMFASRSIGILMYAQEEGRRMGHHHVGTEQILLALIREGGFANKALRCVGINLRDARLKVEEMIGFEFGSGVWSMLYMPRYTPRLKRVMELAFEEATRLGSDYVEPEHILLGLIQEGEGVGARVIQDLGGDFGEIRARVIEMMMQGDLLERYGTNLTVLAKEGKLDPGIGKQEIIESVIRILCRGTKINNALLIGEPDAEKTALVVEGIAHRIANGDVPDSIQGKQIVKLDMRLLILGDEGREERLKKLMEEIKKRDNIILYIDEAHAFIGEFVGAFGYIEGAIDAATILNPAVYCGELQCIGAVSEAINGCNWWYIQEDPYLNSVFEPVNLFEPSVNQTV